jgi:hypothetical protein
MDTKSTVNLADQWFQGDYSQIVEAISKFNENSEDKLCFDFINQVLEMRHQTIMDEYM